MRGAEGRKARRSPADGTLPSPSHSRSVPTGDAARRALRDLLKLEGLDVGELTGAATQVSDGTLVRPDLAVYDRERKERMLIEAKFWAA